MAKNTYLPASDADKSAWLKNFAGKLPLYATLLGLLAEEIAAAAADALMYSFSIDQVGWFKRELAKRVSYKNLLAFGDIGSPLSAYPLVGTIPEVPAAVAPGIFKRTAKVVQRIKNHPKYTASIGEDLGIEAHASIFSMVGAKPDLKVTVVAGKPALKWTKGKNTAVDIYVDRGEGKGFVFLTTAILPHFTDSFALPAGSNVAQWVYKAIYKIGDEQTGSFSDPVNVTVSNHVNAK